MRSLKYTRKELFIIVISLLLFLEIYLKDLVSVFRYFDELIVLVLCPFLFYEKKKNDGLRKVILLLVVILGLISSFVAGIQTSPAPVLTDAFSFIKVFLMYEEAKAIMMNLTRENKVRIVKTLSFVVKLFVMFAFVCGIISLGVNIGMSGGYRYGISAFRFINSNPGQYGLMFYFVFFILSLEYEYKNNIFFLIMASIAWALSMRTRSFAFIVIYFVLFFLIIKKDYRLTFNLKAIIPTALLLVLITFNRIKKYFLTGTAPRALLLRYGVKTMKEFFPLGAGFATYGTDAASKYYSKLYYSYGFDKRRGFMPENGMYLHDNYWPAVMAEVGIIGAIFVIGYLFLQYKELLKSTENNKIRYLAVIFVLVTQIASSAGTPVFFQFVTQAVYFVLPLVFDERENSQP